MNILLGIDSGTSSTKGVATLDDGTVLAEARVEHGVSIPQPGFAEQDAEHVWWNDFAEVARRLMEQLPADARVAGLGVSACGPCLVPVDRAGRALRPGMLYGIDARSGPQIANLEATVGRRAISRLAGSRLTTQDVGPKILWLRDNEADVFRRTASFLTASGFLLLRLTGQSVVDRHHAAYFAPFFDLRRGRWDLRHANGDIEEKQLPRIAWSDEVVGSLTGAAAAATAIPVGTPVVAGSTDGMVEALSAGVHAPGDLLISYGSTSVAMLVLDRPRSGPNLWLSSGLFPGSHVLAGGPAATGSLTTWFRQQLAADIAQGDAQAVGAAHDTLMAEAAASVVGAHGLLLLPYFSGERSPIADPQARGVFAGLSLAHTRGDLYRVILEGSGFAVRHTVEAMRATGAPIQRIVAVGGGASRLGVRIVSDILGLPQEVPAVRFGAAYGSALLAGIGTGLVADSTNPGAGWIGARAVIEPEPANISAYNALYPLYRDLYRRTRATVHALTDFDLEGRAAVGPNPGAASRGPA